MGGAQSHSRFHYHPYSHRRRSPLAASATEQATTTAQQQHRFMFYTPSSYDLEDEWTLYSSSNNHTTVSCTYKTPPISTRFMDTLPTLTLEHDASTLLHQHPHEDTECLICFASYRQGCTLVSLPCGHSYHKACVEEWFCRQCTCPYCRFEYPTDHKGYEVGRQHRMGTRRKQEQNRPLQTSLVKKLKERQEQVRYTQHRQTVLEQLSFSSCPEDVAAGASTSSCSTPHLSAPVTAVPVGVVY